MTHPTVAPPIDHRPPRFTDAEAVRFARELYGLEATASPLPSERDQNFRLTTASGDAFVLKLTEADEAADAVDFQNRMLARLAERVPAYRFPRLYPSRSGEEIERVEADDGTAHFVRLLDHLPGVPLARVRPHSPELLRGVGELLGTVDRALEGFDHPGAGRSVKWDLRHGPRVLERCMDDVDDADRRALLADHLARFRARAGPILPELRTAAIHNDGNDHNVLVEAAAADPAAARGLVGLVDFGDAVRSYVVGEVAIAAAYAMMHKADALAAASRVVRGYHAAYPLTEPELEALGPLIALRLCVSVAVAARQRKRRPDNAYLSVSERGAWALLERLHGIDAAFAHYTFRHACGLPPCPATAPVVEWLDANAGSAWPVIEPDPAAAERIIFDLSVGGVADEALCAPGDDARVWTDRLFDRMRDAGAGVGIGRYDEARVWYMDSAFRVETDEGPEPRTIHLGIDLFAPAGSPVFAPFDARVHGLRDNDGRLDYGPTVILEHAFDDGRVRFFTLYGHLADDALALLEEGEPIRRGQRIGRIGDPPGNGGWAPHLHLQLITDLVGYEGTFPGIARPSERDVWLALSPDSTPLLRIPEDCRARRGMDAGSILEARSAYIGSSLSVSYRRPLHIVRGWMQHLYDDVGRPYLDAVNNVAHVGHSHPRVVDAIRRQSAVLNTNTRYLHERLVRYAERLAATLPEPLSVCWFVCSGSEANELALRMARAHTGGRDVLVIDGAYHGNTGALVELSPYKFDGPGGRGAPPHVQVVPLPDPYRGRHRGDDPDAGRRYAAHVREAADRIHRAGRGLAAFFAEPLIGCGGQVVPPAGYLAEAFRHAREAGAVCVADEVQVGFGRVGTEFWGFETQDAVPDIVTMGKPIGNGHPLAAVVTTPEIAASFDDGMEYFNTFGGNPVSCLVGLAVLDVLEEEGLQENARVVGERLRAGLRGLMDRHPLLGDVRGLGLYIGAELVLDRETREPAGGHAAYVAERMRDHGILISTDGPDHNVLKIKPPLVFSEADADRLVETLDGVLAEDAARAGVRV